jgi:DNA invertase Pin-like site-specific DNA recombinase
MRLVSYTRQSVQNGGDSLEAQLDAILTWTAEVGSVLIAEFTDDGLSGTLDEDGRPGLAGAILAIEEGRADALIIHRLDRLARALHIQEAILSRVWKAGGRVFTVDGNEVLQDDPSDPYRTFVRQVMGAAAQLERGMIRARMQAGRKRARANGRHIGGSAPYGFTIATDGTLQALESEQETIRRIARMREQSVPFRTIAADLGWTLGKVQRAYRNRALLV